MDLNAKDSFYPQFENCNGSSLGMENSVRKDNQEVYVDAERGVPAQFGHGEFTLSQLNVHAWRKLVSERRADNATENPFALRIEASQRPKKHECLCNAAFPVRLVCNFSLISKTLALTKLSLCL